MADILYSGSGDVRLSVAMAQEAQLRLADRAFLFGHPAIAYYGSPRGSAAMKIPLLGLNGYDRMVGVAENASVVPTVVSNTSVTLTVARQSIARRQSDLNELTDGIGFNVPALIADGVWAFAGRFTEMVTNVTDDFTATVGTSGADLTADNWFSAQFTLTQASVPGRKLAILYPVQLTDLQQALRGEAGPWQWRADVQQFLTSKGQGLAGSINDIDVLASSLVPTANGGADSAGAMFGQGAVGYIDGIPNAIRGATEILYQAGTKVYTTLGRDDLGALTQVVHNAFLAVGIIEQSRGVSIITDR